MTVVHEHRLRIVKVAGLGPYDNNGYVLADPASGEAYLVDAPAEVERLLAAAEVYRVRAVLLTHTHPDHVAGYSDLKRQSDLPVAVHPADEPGLPAPADFHLEDQALLPLGDNHIRLIHTPGHTPGAVCIEADGCLVSGDTLFPGGPGATRSPEAFRQVVESITQRLLTLPDALKVLPGHGADTTIAEAKAEYEVFASREHPDGLHGHVRWLES